MISHHHRCIYFHVPKTGGQSIERLFLDDLGLSWEQRAPLLLGANENRKVGPPRLAHMTADEIIAFRYIPERMLGEYFCFATVRNPWSRVVSAFRYITSHARFEEFVDDRIRDGGRFAWFLRPQTDFYYRNGESVCDQVIRLENLKDGAAGLISRFDLSSQLGHVNSSGEALKVGARFKNAVKHTAETGAALEDHSDWREFFTPRTRAIVEAYYARDIDVLGYEFDD
ncbi:sulfotransferase family protein [Aliiruegeria haliotis]|uniref:Sulfotransferase family protein n=1 Tax=Aliiruegeria haliotis TaxID=1280846 RepID=A0A2T0RNA2_9RHOB|nr:sulfotransferase family protein [Aliiruegeria haliotis]